MGFWPSFRDAILAAHSAVRASDLETAREYNRLRYHYQGIGCYEPEQIYASGIDDLRVVADLLSDIGYVFGPDPATIDAAIYGFVANIHFHEIETPLKQYLFSRPALTCHCEAIQQRIATPVKTVSQG